MSPTPIDLFLLDLDAQWPAGGVMIPLKVIGSTALMLQTNYIRGTKDSDVLGVDPVLGKVAENLLALAGENTFFHRKHQVYLDVVDHTHLVERFLSAAEVFSMGAGAHRLTGYSQNLNWVEREYLGVPETEYELPPWADV